MQTCENCGNRIGSLEHAYDHQGHAVCGPCWQRLNMVFVQPSQQQKRGGMNGSQWSGAILAIGGMCAAPVLAPFVGAEPAMGIALLAVIVGLLVFAVGRMFPGE